jgi:DeoR/GlpR family transcriptional regulator of sugar metabolism
MQDFSAKKNDQLLSFDRRKKILEIVNLKKSITVDALAEMFSVSKITVSRDLEKLEDDSLLKRVRGGAVALSHIVTSPRASQASKVFTDEQKRIGAAAAELISNGDFIIIESGSTCLALVENLVEKDNLKIVTASPMIAMRLAEITEQYDKKFEILVSGGLLNVYKSFLLGPTAIQTFENINVDIAFLSITAIDLEAGITADDVNESAVTKVILETCAEKTVGLIVSSKFGKISFLKVSDVTVFDEIVTGRELNDQTVGNYIRAGIKMTLC